MYRALPVRENPRLGVVKAVLRTYVDVLHIERNQKERIFAGGAALQQLNQRALLDAGLPSPARSDHGSQVRKSQRHHLTLALMRTAQPRSLDRPPQTRARSQMDDDGGDAGGDTQDPFALNNLLRQNLATREDQLVSLGRRADIYEQLTASLAPSIWEMDDVKKGILCQLFGAVNKVWGQGLKD